MTTNKTPEIFYHGSTSDFTKFDICRIRADETDAAFNGFWFTSDKNSASPAWRNPKFIKSFYITINNPAPYAMINSLYNELFDDTQKSKETFQNYKSLYGDKIRSSCDIMRYALQEMGYDGVIVSDKPNVSREKFEMIGSTYFTTVKGNKYSIKKDMDFGGVDYYRVYKNGYEEYITGYESFDDFMDQHSERVVVAFNPEQIKFIFNEDLGQWK